MASYKTYMTKMQQKLHAHTHTRARARPPEQPNITNNNKRDL